MAILFDVAYLLLLTLVAPILLIRSLKTGKYREGWRQRLFGAVPKRTRSRPCIWFHAVSVGEINLLPPLVAALRRAYPDWEVVVSTTTRTGMELARKRFADQLVFYAPLDFSWTVAHVLNRIRPSILVLTELEIWPALIRAAKARGVRVAIINGRLGDRSFNGYRRLRWLLQSTIAALDLVAVQDAECKRRFEQLGARTQALHITGSMKYDGAEGDRNHPATVRLRQLAGIAPNEVVWIAGSTQEEEETLALSVMQRLRLRFPRLRLIIVPRHPERFEAVAEMLKRSGVPWLRRSELERPRVPTDNQRGDHVPDYLAERDQPKHKGPGLPILLVDTVGELGAWWGLADIALVGGSFGSRGGQNMIEPAAYGATVCFGPNTWNFRDVVRQFLQAKAAVVVHDSNELEQFVRTCLENPDYRSELGGKARDLVAAHRGATQATLNLLAPWLGEMTRFHPSQSGYDGRDASRLRAAG